MKIIIATFRFFPNIDGVAEASRNMADFFVKAGHQVSIATGPVTSHNNETLNIDTKIHRFSISGSPMIGSGFVGETNKYLDFLRQSNADILIFHGWDTWPVEVALPILLELPARSILLSHGYAAHMLPSLFNFPKGFRKWLYLLPHVLSLPNQIKSFDRVVFLSGKLDLNRFFDATIAKVFRCKNTSIISNSITSDWLHLPNEKTNIPWFGNGCNFLCVANYSIRKNQEMALMAFCKANIPGSTLVFAGSELGEYGQRVQDYWLKIKANHPDLSVYFLENLSRREIVSAFRFCDVFVLSATAETQPIVILEAIACGKPFISTDTGCVSELKGGLVVNNLNQMANKMRFLADNTEARHELGQQGMSYFNQFCSPETTRHAWLNLIEEVVNEKSISSV